MKPLSLPELRAMRPAIDRLVMDALRAMQKDMPDRVAEAAIGFAGAEIERDRLPLAMTTYAIVAMFRHQILNQLAEHMGDKEFTDDEKVQIVATMFYSFNATLALDDKVETFPGEYRRRRAN